MERLKVKFREILNALARLREEPGVVIRLAKVFEGWSKWSRSYHQSACLVRCFKYVQTRYDKLIKYCKCNSL